VFPIASHADSRTAEIPGPASCVTQNTDGKSYSQGACCLGTKIPNCFKLETNSAGDNVERAECSALPVHPGWSISPASIRIYMNSDSKSPNVGGDRGNVVIERKDALQVCWKAKIRPAAANQGGTMYWKIVYDEQTPAPRQNLSNHFNFPTSVRDGGICSPHAPGSNPDSPPTITLADQRCTDPVNPYVHKCRPGPAPGGANNPWNCMESNYFCALPGAHGAIEHHSQCINGVFYRCMNPDPGNPNAIARMAPTGDPCPVIGPDALEGRCLGDQNQACQTDGDCSGDICVIKPPLHATGEF
jgi:hypothetical protein